MKRKYVIRRYLLDVLFDESPYAMDIEEAELLLMLSKKIVSNNRFELKIEPAPIGKPYSTTEKVKSDNRKDDNRKLDKNGKLKHL
jgi:hypothetical protein